jgi:uncharacterized repeat protein (TIGR01451 family)
MFVSRLTAFAITMPVMNVGGANLQAPFYVATYKENATLVANKPSVDNCPTSLIRGDTIVVDTVIRDFSTYLPSANVDRGGINDRSESRVVRPECRTVTPINATIPLSNILMANHDYVATFEGIMTFIPVLQNDSIPDIPTICDKLDLVTIAGSAKHGMFGVIELNGVRTDTVCYISNPGFVGYDTITYRIKCDNSSATSIAKVFVTVQAYPDNVGEAYCVIDPDAKAWSIRKTQQIDSIATVSPFVVGDLNDDGFPDIVGYGDKYYRSIRVIWGPDFSTNYRYSLPATEIRNTIAIAKVKTAEPSTYRSMIYYQINDLSYPSTNKLYAMDPADGSQIWETDVPNWNTGAIGVADFNNDGWAEVYVGNQIYDAATGKLLCRGYEGENSGNGDIISYRCSMPIAIDILGDEKLELVTGNCIYEVNIDRNSMNTNDLTEISRVVPPSIREDGFTVVADFNDDGKLEVLVRQRDEKTWNLMSKIRLYLWSPHTGTNVGRILAETSDYNRFTGVPFVGDIDGDGKPEIVTLDSDGTFDSSFIPQPGLRARKYNETTGVFDFFWEMNHTDETGATGMTLFDFNNDGISEIVYRDENQLRIINGSKKHHQTGLPVAYPYALDSFISYSLTGVEYPIIADIYGNGSSAILVTSDFGGPRQNVNGTGIDSMATVDVFTSNSPIPWSPARRVWNQYAYNAVNVNEDLTIPAVQLNLATRFQGADGIIGTADDPRPYNAFLQQQTRLNKNGLPLWLAADAVFDRAQTTAAYDSDSVWVHVCIVNQGEAVLSSPVYLSLYRGEVSSAKFIKVDSIMEDVRPGDNACLTIGADIAADPLLPSVQLIVRLNDKGPDSQGAGRYPYQAECETCCDSIETLLNPALARMMEKHATLNGGQPDELRHDGTYGNPVSVLYGDTIEYEITAVNANVSAGTVIIRDTLPTYMEYVASSAQITIAGSGGVSISTGTVSATPGVPELETVRWEIPSVASLASVKVRFEATPKEGASATQPLYVNRAWVQTSDTLYVHTNSTYHQGAGVAIITFSAAGGGSIFNAERQALDYRTTPRAGVVVVPDSGYVFAGWQHDAYVSLRGEQIPAASGVMHLDSLVIYGDVELRANFVPASAADQGKEAVAAHEEKGDKVWAHEETLYVRTLKGVEIRVYTPEGILRRHFVAVADGLMTCRLTPGIYLVTLNGGAGYKVLIE